MKILGIKGIFKSPEGNEQLEVVSIADSALLMTNRPFFIPDFAPVFIGHTSIALRINRLGKHVPMRYAHRYYDAVAACMNAEAAQFHGCRNRMDARVTSFDGAIMLGTFIDKDSLDSLAHLQVDTCLNGEKKSGLNMNDLTMSFDRIIEVVSKHFTLKMGDLLIAVGNDAVDLPIGKSLSMTVEGRPSLVIRLR